MAATAFTKHLGVTQGRLAVESTDGTSYAFVLGSLTEGQHELLAAGHSVQLGQAVDLTGLSLLRVRALFRTPSNVPQGFRWKMALVVDGVEASAYYGLPGVSRTLKDIAADVEALTGTHNVALRLSLVAS